MGKPALTITNGTRWSGRDLRRMVRACMDHLGVAERKVVAINYHKRRRRPTCTDGRAVIGQYQGNADTGFHVVEGVRVWLELPRPGTPIDVLELPQVIEHELMHTLGHHHNNMVPWWRLPVPWAAGLTVAWRPERAKPTRQQAVAAAVRQREALARKHLAALEAQAVRQAKLLAKWRARVRYYDRRAAAATRAPKETP